MNPKPVCVPTDSLTRVEPSPELIFTLPKWTLLILGLTECIFILIKSATLPRTESSWLKIALISFIVETIVGFSLTTIQCFILFDLNFRKVSSEQNIDQVIGPLLFVLTELSAVISETIFIRRKIAHQKSLISNNHHRLRFSLVRRVAVKWITLSASLVSVIFSRRRFESYYTLQDEDSIVFKILLAFIIILILCYGIFTIPCYSRYWTRIVTSTLVLVVISLLSVVILFIKYNYGDFVAESYYNGSCGTFMNKSYILVFTLGLNIFLTSLSAFRLHGYKESKSITAEQVEFFETAVFGISCPCLWLSYTLCVDEATLLFLVACPQVAVLLTPFMFEYIEVLFSTITRWWKTNAEYFIGNNP